MINEFGLEYDLRVEHDRRYHFLKLLERLKRAGVPLDGVGLQERPTCQWCGLGKLIFIDERADPNSGALGMTCQVLKCDAPECSELTSV